MSSHVWGKPGPNASTVFPPGYQDYNYKNFDSLRMCCQHPVYQVEQVPAKAAGNGCDCLSQTMSGTTASFVLEGSGQTSVSKQGAGRWGSDAYQHTQWTPVTPSLSLQIPKVTAGYTLHSLPALPQK